MKKMMFKPKQRFDGHNVPKKNEDVIVYQCVIYPDGYRVVGYEKDFDGISMSINKRHFAEPQTNALSKELANEFIRQDSKIREQEFESVPK